MYMRYYMIILECYYFKDWLVAKTPAFHIRNKID